MLMMIYDMWWWSMMMTQRMKCEVRSDVPRWSNVLCSSCWAAHYDIFKYLFAMIRLDLTTMTMMLYGMMVMVMGMVLEVIVRSGNNGDDFQFSMMLIINEMKILWWERCCSRWTDDGDDDDNDYDDNDDDDDDDDGGGVKVESFCVCFKRQSQTTTVQQRYSVISFI